MSSEEAAAEPPARSRVPREPQAGEAALRRLGSPRPVPLPSPHRRHQRRLFQSSLGGWASWRPSWLGRQPRPAQVFQPGPPQRQARRLPPRVGPLALSAGPPLARAPGWPQPVPPPRSPSPPRARPQAQPRPASVQPAQPVPSPSRQAPPFPRARPSPLRAPSSASAPCKRQTRLPPPPARTPRRSPRASSSRPPARELGPQQVPCRAGRLRTPWQALFDVQFTRTAPIGRRARPTLNCTTGRPVLSSFANSPSARQNGSR
jgi:hypothetical protein